ncbi:hypothetical protein A7P53_16650 [Acinetobacter defluvii]|uniref:FRG domain-containing protein n=1 Tax=Acinetobacter defluvii TaxID=1871111 RepID=A0A2S2FEI3_9GAMM|nr:FRG domain-containing protein [Acinetobacter defluvii]AWL29215.1 FRG domain-containing protein [Acinetobacter defluvii]NNP71401.1 hypothetical protein [Acinetobacter defluvii]
MKKVDYPERGYFEINIDHIDNFIELIRPDKENLRQYLNYANKKLLFRGQENSEWELTPNLFRSIPHFIARKFDGLAFVEWTYLHSFVKACDLNGVQIPYDSMIFRNNFLNEFPNSCALAPAKWPLSEYYELLSFAQHYGISTQLLDWSYQPLVACYFAASNVVKNNNIEGDFSIWCMDIEKINLLNDFEKKNIEIIDVPKSLNQNISSQQGCFTLVRQDVTRDSKCTFCDEKKRIKEVTLVNDLVAKKEQHTMLLKINLPNKFASDVLNFCDAYSINATTIFRGVTGASQHVKDQINKNKFDDCLRSRN